MQKGELEDYYLKENFGDEFSNISGKGITAYKIAELAPIVELLLHYCYFS